MPLAWGLGLLAHTTLQGRVPFPAAMFCLRLELQVSRGLGATLRTVGWWGLSSSARGCGSPGVIDNDRGERRVEQPEAPPVAGICRGTPGLAGRRVPSPLCCGADPALVAVGGRGGVSAVNGSEHSGTVQRGRKPW